MLGQTDGTVVDATPELGTSGQTGTDVYAVKIDGETHQVTLDELLKGYSRQQDYTRKAQALSEQRKRLEGAELLLEALNRDPASTLEVIAQQYQVDPYEVWGIPSPTTDEYGSEIDFGSWTDDPWEDQVPTQEIQALQAEINQLKSLVSQQVQTSASQQVKAQIEKLKAEYPNVDVQAVTKHALDHNLSDLEVAYLHMNRETLASSLKTEAQRQAEEARIREEKLKANAISPTGSVASGSVQVPVQEPGTLREALEAAMAEHGVSDMSHINWDG